MRKTAAIIFIIICVACAAATQATSYKTLKTRADRFFNNDEWPSATAYYTYMLQQRPEVADTYGRAIVSSMMAGDTVRPLEMLKDAMAHKVPLDSVLAGVRLYAYAKDSADFYPRFLLSVAHNEKWLARPIDAMLLNYYTQRNDGPMIVRYAGIMLAGLPDDTRFLSALARGYMLTGNYDLATDTWQKILNTDPHNYEALLQLAAFYAADNNMQLARPYFERAFSLRPTPYVASILEKNSDRYH